MASQSHSLEIEFTGVNAAAPGHNQIVLHHGDAHIVLSPCKSYEGATHAIVCDYDRDDWHAWEWYVKREIPLYAEGAICEALKHEEIGKHLKSLTKPLKIDGLNLHVLKAPVAPRQPAAGVMLPEYRVCIVPELPTYISQALIKAFGYPPKHIIVGIGSFEKSDHKISFKDFKEQIKRVLQPPEKGILSLTLTNFRKDLKAHKSEVIKELKEIFPNIPIIWAEKGMRISVSRDGADFKISSQTHRDGREAKEKTCPIHSSLPACKKLNLVENNVVREKLHLEEFRSEGVDFDLAHAEDRWQELIMDLRILGNSAYPRLKKGKKWGDWTLADVKKYFAKIIDVLRSECKFPWIPPFGEYSKLYKKYYKRDPKQAAKSSFWKLYKEAERYMKTKPPKSFEEAKEWDKARKSIIKTKSLKPGWYSDVKPKFRFEIDLLESDLAHLGWDKKVLLVDPKWDGLRLTLGKIKGKGFAWVDPEDLKERSPDVTDRVPEIIKEIEEHWPDNTICDAELIAMDFPEVLHRTCTLAMLRTKESAENFVDYLYAAVFDIMYFKGEEVEHKPLKDRIEILQKIPWSDHIFLERVSERLVPGGFAYLCHDPKEVRQAWNLIVSDKAVKFRGQYIRKAAEGVMVKLWEEDTREKQQNPAEAKMKIWRECDLVVLARHTVKGTTDVFNYYLGIDISPEYAAKLLDDKKLKKWVVALDGDKLITGVSEIRNLLKKRAKVRYLIYYGKSDNTKLKLKVGDILRVASEEVIRYENEAHPEAPLFRGYINRAMEPIPEKHVSDSLDVFNRLSLLEPKRVPIEELMRWRQESIKEKSFKSRGLYLPEPHARLIAEGKKVLILKDRKYNIADEIFLFFDHDKAYGYLLLGNPFPINSRKEFLALQPLHHVTEDEYKKWKFDIPIYAYPVREVMRFPHPKKISVPKGVQNFLDNAHEYIVDEKSLEGSIAFVGDRPVMILSSPSHVHENEHNSGDMTYNI